MSSERRLIICGTWPILPFVFGFLLLWPSFGVKIAIKLTLEKRLKSFRFPSIQPEREIYEWNQPWLQGGKMSCSTPRRNICFSENDINHNDNVVIIPSMRVSPGDVHLINRAITNRGDPITGRVTQIPIGKANATIQSFSWQSSRRIHQLFKQSLGLLQMEVRQIMSR